MKNNNVTTDKATLEIIENAFSNFTTTYEEKLNSDSFKELKKKEIIENKKKKLLPILGLLNKLKEVGLVVHNAKKYNINNTEFNIKEEVLFNFSKRDTVGLNAPGIDLIIEHPCFISITIPNENNIEEFGSVIITVRETFCPHVDLIRNKTFYTVESAAQALATFFAKNAISLMKTTN